jgi:fibronectin-binding autotransporter adhesin
MEQLGSRILLDADHWIAPAGGLWSVAGNWDLGRAPGPADDAIIGPTGGPVIHDPSTDSIHSLTLATTLQVSGTMLTISDSATVASEGSLQVNASGFNGATVTVANALMLNGTAQLSSNFFGPGQVVTRRLAGSGAIFLLSGDYSSSNTIQAPNSTTPLVIGSGITIYGAGTVGSPSTTFVNHGTIRADVPGGMLTLTGTDWRNAGTLRANAGSVINLAGTMANADSTGSLAGTGFFTVSGQVSGGTLNLPAGAKLHGADGTLNGVTLNGDMDLSAMGFGSSNLNVINGLTFNGTATLAGSFFGTALLNFRGTQTLSGTGTIGFENQYGGSVQVVTPDTTLTIGPDITIHGQTGTVGGTGNVAFVNQGTISADVSGGTITLTGTGWSSIGTVRAENGGTLLTQGTTGNFANGTLRGGTWQVLAYSTLRLLNADIVTNAATIVLDGLNANWYRDTATTDGLDDLATNAGSFTISDGRALTLTGSLANVGMVTIGNGSRLTTPDAYLQFAGTTSLAGGVLAAGSPDAPQLVDIQGGILSGGGAILADVNLAGELDVGDGGAPGSLTIAGNYRQTGTSILNLALGTPDEGGSDQLSITGQASLDGTLDVTLLDSFVANEGDPYQILTFGSAVGTFAQMNLPDVGNGLFLSPSYDANDLTLIVTAGS